MFLCDHFVSDIIVTLLRDLKPENLLYATIGENAPLRLADFGLACLQNDDEAMSVACGTPGYVAPEVIAKQVQHGQGQAADLWSIGVILYVLLCGYPPFQDDDMHKLFEKIKLAHFEFHPEYWGDVSTAAKDLISALLVADPASRLTATQALNHPWLAPHGGNKHHLPNFKTTLTAYNARRKLKKAIRSVMFARQLQKMVEKSRAVDAFCQDFDEAAEVTRSGERSHGDVSTTVGTGLGAAAQAD